MMLFFNGNGDYCSVLWCMKTILFGSYLSYAILLFFKDVQQNLLLYTVLFLLTFLNPAYTAFWAGLAAAKILARPDAHKSKRAFGGLLVLAGLVLGNIPEILLPPSISIFTCYGFGAFLLLSGSARSSIVRKFLAHPWLVCAGEYSFALVLVHFAVIMSVCAWLFLLLQGEGVSYPLAFFLTLLTAVPLNAVAAVLFHRLVERPTERLTRWIYAKMIAPAPKP